MSVQLLRRVIGGVSTLPTSLKAPLEHHSGGDQETFPSLPVTAEIGDFQEEEGARPLVQDSTTSWIRRGIEVVGFVGTRFFSTRQLEIPVQASNRGAHGDLQWRMVHGAVATNRHVAHIDPRCSE
ncbi:hypothetical protein SRHO_G00049400 [Serrasalmus rhombeus]